MALPDTVNTVYVAGVSEVKSADLNDLQTSVVAHEKRVKALDPADWVYVDAAGVADPRTRTTVVDANGLRAGDGYTKSSHFASQVTLTSNGGNYYLALPRIPYGSVITGVKVLVDPGVARASSSNRMKAVMSRLAGTNFTTPAVGTSSQYAPVGNNFDDGTSSLQVINLTYASLTVDGDPLLMTIIAGNDAATNNDKFHGLEITWIDYGPKNY